MYLLLTSYFLKSRPDGRTTGALNLGESNFKDVGQIKHSEGYDRASKEVFPSSYLLVSVLIWICQDHQWADVNGDGLVDFLWVDKFSGDTSVRETQVLIRST